MALSHPLHLSLEAEMSRAVGSRGTEHGSGQDMGCGELQFILEVGPDPSACLPTRRERHGVFDIQQPAVEASSNLARRARTAKEE